MLPKDFKQEVGESKYILNKLKTGGKIKFRLLTDFINGKSVWGEGEDGKRVPTRKRAGESMPVGAIGINQFTGEPENIKQFIAGVVWNYEAEQLEVFETDKATIIGQIVEIESNEDWGDSTGYDLSITRKGEKMETKYTVLPSNKGKFDCPEDVSTINVEALFSNEDPFKSDGDGEDKPKMMTDKETQEVTDSVPF